MNKSDLERLIKDNALIDVHMHTTASDGVYSPEELTQRVRAAGIKLFAFTDHDSCASLRAGAELAARCGLRFLNGIELGTQYGGHSFHVLGYGIDAEHEPLLQKIASLRRGREERLLKILSRLAALGIKIDPCQVDARDRAVGRPHVARALVKLGYVRSYAEAFDRYLARGKPAYEPQPRLLPREAVKLIHDAGGVAVLAHPEEVGDRNLARNVLGETCWDGVEVFHPSNRSEEGQNFWRCEAEARDLFITGGDDFHGNAGRFPEQLGVFCVYASQVQNFLRRCAEKIN